jgi:hypothetical protein
MKTSPLAFVTPWAARRTSLKRRCSGASASCSTATCSSSLIVRVGPDGYEEALLEAHVKKFDITGRPMKGRVLVEPEGVEDDEQLKGWIQQAVKFVGKLPGK